MRIIGAFLAETASVVDDKLNVIGGVLSSAWVSPERVANVTLVVLTQAESGDIAGDEAPKLTVELVAPGGDSQAVAVTMPPGSLANEIGFAYWSLWLPVEIDGRYKVMVGEGPDAIALPLLVEEWAGA